jgi:hypothetical protein
MIIVVVVFVAAAAYAYAAAAVVLQFSPLLPWPRQQEIQRS